LVYSPYSKYDSSTPEFDKLEQEVEENQTIDEEPSEEAQPDEEVQPEEIEPNIEETQPSEEVQDDTEEDDDKEKKDTNTPNFDDIEKNINKKVGDPDEEWEKMKKDYEKNKEKYGSIVK
jgi:hypothetical protein